MVNTFKVFIWVYRDERGGGFSRGPGPGHEDEGLRVPPLLEQLRGEPGQLPQAAQLSQGGRGGAV